MDEKLDLGERGVRFVNNALRCVALRCVALRCVALRCVAESFCLQIKSSKKQQIIKIDGRKASFCEMFRFAQHDKSLATLERDLG